MRREVIRPSGIDADISPGAVIVIQVPCTMSGSSLAFQLVTAPGGAHSSPLQQLVSQLVRYVSSGDQHYVCEALQAWSQFQVRVTPVLRLSCCVASTSHHQDLLRSSEHHKLDQDCF